MHLMRHINISTKLNFKNKTSNTMFVKKKKEIVENEEIRNRIIEAL